MISLIIQIRHTWQPLRAILGLHWQCILVFVYSSILTTGVLHSCIKWLAKHIQWSAICKNRWGLFYFSTPLKSHDSVQFLCQWFTEACISDVVLYHNWLACLATHILVSPIHFASALVEFISKQRLGYVRCTSYKQSMLNIPMGNVTKTRIDISETASLKLR